MSNRQQIVVGVLIGLAFWLGMIVDSQAASISEYATKLVGKPTSVHCVRMSASMKGYTTQYEDGNGNKWFDPDIYLSPATCYALHNAIEHRPDHSYAKADAILTLTHEAEHIILNSGNESIVSCNAILRINRSLRLFRVPNLAYMHKLAWASYWDAPDSYTNDPVCASHAHTLFLTIGPVLKRGKNEA